MGYGMSWSSNNTPATCGGQASSASAVDTDSGAESEDADSEDGGSSAGNGSTPTTANSGDISCSDAPALDWAGVDVTGIGGEAGVSPECRNRNFQ